MECDPTRVCELLVGLGDVEVLGVDDTAKGPLRVHIRWRRGVGAHNAARLPGVLRVIYERTGKAGRSSPFSATRLAQPNRTDRICSRACCSVRPIASAPGAASHSATKPGGEVMASTVVCGWAWATHSLMI